MSNAWRGEEREHERQTGERRGGRAGERQRERQAETERRERDRQRQREERERQSVCERDRDRVRGRANQKFIVIDVSHPFCFSFESRVTRGESCGLSDGSRGTKELVVGDPTSIHGDMIDPSTAGHILDTIFIWPSDNSDETSADIVM
jgi:hypothetical protein